MVDRNAPRLNKLSPDELGNQLAELTSTSEALQKVAVGCGMAAGIGAGFFSTDVSIVFWIFGGALFAGGVALVGKKVKRFRTRITVFEHGMVVACEGKAHRFLYSQVDQYDMKHTHHYSRVAGSDVYVGSRVITDVVVEGKFTSMKWNSEYHKQKSTCETVCLISEKLCTAVELKLARRLETDGEIPLTKEVFLTMDGLRIVDRQVDSEQLVGIEEIETWQHGDEGISLFKTGSGLPFLRLSNDGTNFPAAFSLFEKLHRSLTDEPVAV